MTVVGVERARAASTPVTIFLERNGRAVSDDVKIPRFGGGDRAWRGIVGCVREHYAPFQVEVVDHKPARGKFITAVVGGRASQLGLDDRWTNGVGPHTGRVIPSAIVFVFSKVGTGERDVANLCAVTAHEVAHALGLDHSFKCGDIMSYWLDRCGTRRFMDFDAPCGEDEARKCAGGARTQNSYRRLGALVGFRSTPAPEPEPEPAPESEPESELEPELEPALEPELEPELEVDVDVDTDFRDDMDRDVDDMDVGRDVGPADPYREDDGDEDAYDDDAYDDNAYDDDAYDDDAPAPRSRAPNRAPNRARNRLRSTEPQRPSVGHCGRRRS